MGYDFFFSYARANNDAYLKRLFDDLSEVVRSTRGLPRDAEVGFIDQRNIELGEEWDPAIVEALQTSGAVVALLSPAYFKSDYCGRELALFDARRSFGIAAGQPPPPVIKPVVWWPFKEAEVPPPFDAGQRTFGDPHGPQNTLGFRYLLKQLREHETEYNDLVLALGNQIVAAVDAHPLPRLPSVPRLAATRSLFRSAGAAAQVPPAAAGPKHVRFVYVAAAPRDFGPARSQDAYLDAGGSDWKPFFPANTTRVHRLLQSVVAADDLDFTSEELPFGANLVEEIEEAWKKRQIVVLVVDGWSLQWNQGYRDVLTELDGRLDYHWCVLVPWNEQDPDSVARQKEIVAAMGATFDRHARLSRNPMFFRDGIKSAEELKSAVREVLTRLKEEIRKRAEVVRPIPEGPSKSTLSGPSRQV